MLLYWVLTLHKTEDRRCYYIGCSLSTKQRIEDAIILGAHSPLNYYIGCSLSTKTESGKKSSSMEYYWRLHGCLVGDPKILIGDTHTFIGDPIFRRIHPDSRWRPRDFHFHKISMFLFETPNSRWRPPDFHWRPPDFSGGLQRNYGGLQ